MKRQFVVPEGVRRFAVAFALCAVSLGAFGGRTIYVYTTGEGTMPTGWNKLSFYNSHKPTLSSALKDSEGNATGVKLYLISPATGYGYVSTLPYSGDAEEFEVIRSMSQKTTCVAYTTDPLKEDECGPLPSASYRGWYEPNIRARFEGLDPTKLYELSFVGQREDRNIDHSTRYVATGATTGSYVLDSNGCTNRVARIPGIAPMPDGTIEFTVEPAESNTWANRFAYLSFVKLEEMDELPPQEIFIDAHNAPAVTTTWTWNTVPMGSKGIFHRLLDRDGNRTHVGIEVSAASNGSNSNADLTLTGDAAEFDDSRAGSNRQLYYNKGAHGKAVVFGLYPNCTYTFTFVASRKDSDTSKKYTTKYSVTGANSGSATLDARSNTTKVAKVCGIRPNEYGTATIGIDMADDCNVNWFYICAFKITRETTAAAGARAVAVNVTAGGSVSATVDGVATNCTCYLATDKSLVATATPEAGYRFVGWTSSITNVTASANPITIPATQSATLTAVFEKDETSVRKTMYVDAYGTPMSDTKTWNKLGRATYGWNQTQGPYLAADGTAVPVAIRTVVPITLGTNGSGRVNSEATESGVTFTGEAADFEAARDKNQSLFISINHGGGTNSAVAMFDVLGLKTGHPYTFRFMAARKGTGVRGTLYRAIGQNRVTTFFNPLGNSTKAAIVPDVLPDANGKVRFEFLSSPNTESSQRYVYLTAFSIEGDFTDTPGRRILWFGNSFSNGGNIPERVANLAELAGHPRPMIVNASVDGKNLAYHIKQVETNASANVSADVIKYFSVGNWDDVVIQGYSTEATSAYSTPPASGFIPNATNLYAKVLASAKGAGVRAVFYQTWARGVGHEFYPDTFASPSAMQREISANYRAVTRLAQTRWGVDSVVMAPVGDAFDAAGYVADFYSSDLYHAGGKYGHTLVSMVLYNTIYGTFVDEDVTYAQALAADWTSLTESEWNLLTRLARGISAGTMVIFR